MLGTAAACLATATIVSSSLPADAFPISELRSERHGAPRLMVLAEAGESADERADVTGLMSDLKRGGSAESVLNTMIKINEAVDADEDGLLENPFAREVSALEVQRVSGFGFVRLKQFNNKLSTAVVAVSFVVLAPDIHLKGAQPSSGRWTRKYAGSTPARRTLIRKEVELTEGGKCVCE